MTLQELGQSIREKREAEGLTIEDVSAHIKISSRILRGIEDGNLAVLPHAVYTKGFVRAFALNIHYDPEKLNAMLESVFPQESLNETSSTPTFTNYSNTQYPGGVGKRLLVLTLLVLLLGGVVGGCWYVAVTYGDQIIELVKKPFSAVTGPTEEDPKSKDGEHAPGTTSGDFPLTLEAFLGGGQNGQSASLPAAHMTPLPDEPKTAQTSFIPTNNSPALAGVAAFAGEQATRNALPGQTALQRIEAGPDAPSEPLPVAHTGVGPLGADSVTANPESTNRLIIHADGTCWVGFKADGTSSSRTLYSGEQAVFTYSKKSELVLGNAGGVTLEHNGKNMGRPGGAGRKVILDFPEAGQ